MVPRLMEVIKRKTHMNKTRGSHTHKHICWGVAQVPWRCTVSKLAELGGVREGFQGKSALS